VDKSGQTQRLSDGRTGYFAIPAEMQGTWYSVSDYDDETTHTKYVFGQSTIFTQDDKHHNRKLKQNSVSRENLLTLLVFIWEIISCGSRI